MKTIVKYQCEYCGELFDKDFVCKVHERYIHECIKCKYHKITGQYSDEIECTRKKCIHGDI